MSEQNRSEIDQAEAALRRGIGYALLFALGFWIVVVLLFTAIGMTGSPRVP